MTAVAATSQWRHVAISLLVSELTVDILILSAFCVQLMMSNFVQNIMWFLLFNWIVTKM